MKSTQGRVVWTVGLISVSAAAMASEPQAPPPQEPVGFITGGVIGGLAAGPVGAVIGAGLGTWLGNRVHRAGEAKKAEARVAALETDKRQLQADAAALVAEKGDLSQINRALTAHLDQLSQDVDAAQTGKDDETRQEAARVLDGMQGDVLFRTGSADITPQMTAGIVVLADAVAKTPGLKVRVDGYADPRGTALTNLRLSEARAHAVRDLFRQAGVSDSALEITAFGKSKSVAADSDGYAFERRVRLTLEAPVAEATRASALQVSENQ